MIVQTNNFDVPDGNYKHVQVSTDIYQTVTT